MVNRYTPSQSSHSGDAYLWVAIVTGMGWKGTTCAEIKVWPGVCMGGSLSLVATNWDSSRSHS